MGKSMVQKSPRLKGWFFVWLASSGIRVIDTGVGSYTANEMSMKGRPGYLLASGALLVEGATQALVIVSMKNGFYPSIYFTLHNV